MVRIIIKNVVRMFSLEMLRMKWGEYRVLDNAKCSPQPWSSSLT